MELIKNLELPVFFKKIDWILFDKNYIIIYLFSEIVFVMIDLIKYCVEGLVIIFYKLMYILQRLRPYLLTLKNCLN